MNIGEFYGDKGKYSTMFTGLEVKKFFSVNFRGDIDRIVCLHTHVLL